jgi:hypothetical protein
MTAYDPHALSQMRRRHISREQIEYLLKNYTTTFPARARPGRPFRAIVYLAEVDGRPLKVYIREHSNPPYVLTAAWQDEED